MKKIAILGQYLASSCVVNGTTAKCYTHSCVGLCKLVTLIAGKWRHLLFVGDDDEGL